MKNSPISLNRVDVYSREIVLVLGLVPEKRFCEVAPLYVNNINSKHDAWLLRDEYFPTSGS